MIHRRDSDKDLVGRIWSKISPYFHVISVTALLLFTLGGKSNTVDAHTIQLADHEKRLKVVEEISLEERQELRDLVDFFGIKHKGGISP